MNPSSNLAYKISPVPGEIGQAILKGIIWTGLKSPQDPNSWSKAKYLASVTSDKQAQELREAFAIGSNPSSSINLEVWIKQNVEVAKKSRVIILATQAATVLAILKDRGMSEALRGKLLISLAPGVTVSEMETAIYLNDDPPDGQVSQTCCIFRATVNTAASSGASGTAVCVSRASPVDEATLRLAHSFFKCIGFATSVAESQMDAASVVCQASPALIALFCDAIIDGAVAGGLNRAQAEAMTANALGSYQALASEEGRSRKPSEVREKACASRGIPMWAIMELEKGGARGLISGAVRDTILTSEFLGKRNG